MQSEIFVRAHQYATLDRGIWLLVGQRHKLVQ